jgi:hypothetical protein
MQKLKKNVVVRMRVSDYLLAKRVAQMRGENLSDLVRRAVLRELASLGYLDEEAKKALGFEAQVQIRGEKDGAC